jgi:hypothetical protein
MKGYHVVWEAPRTQNYMQWEVLLQLLSAKFWKEVNGHIGLLCDQKTLDYYKSLGMDEVYDEIEILDKDLLEGIDPKIYFAAGKLAAMLQVQGDKVAFLDTDLLLTQLPEPFDLETVTVFHREALNDKVYPNFWDKWQTEEDVDISAMALNCALVIWPQEELRRNYASTALKFMRSNTYHGRMPKNVLMVTAEQRMLGMFLKNRGIIPNYVIKDIYIPTLFQKSLSWMQDGLGSNLEQISEKFLHLWGHKAVLREDPFEAAEYTMQLFNLCERYPELDVESILNKMSK